MVICWNKGLTVDELKLLGTLGSVLLARAAALRRAAAATVCAAGGGAGRGALPADRLSSTICMWAMQAPRLAAALGKAPCRGSSTSS